MWVPSSRDDLKAQCTFTSEPALCFLMLGHIPFEGEKVLGSSPEAKPTILPYPPNRMITRRFFELKEVFSSGLETVKNLLLR